MIIYNRFSNEVIWLEFDFKEYLFFSWKNILPNICNFQIKEVLFSFNEQ